MNTGFDDVNVVVVEECVTCKDEAQNSFLVDASLVWSEVVNPVSIAGDRIVHTRNLDGNGDTDKLNKKDTSCLTVEDLTQDAERAKMKFGVQDVAFGNGFMDDKSVKEFEAVDTSEIQEFTTTDNFGTDDISQ